jgi:ribosomal protein S18 acetylase RimI-like enzyme
MSSFEFKPASTYSTLQIVDLLTRSFEGYLVPIHIDESALLTMLRRDGIDLHQSRILMKGDEPIGVALIARRGWTSRLAAMGILSHARNSGAGTWAMQNLIDQALARGDREMTLEVIEQNMAGVKLYEKVGFNKIRRLVGYKLENPQVDSKDELQEVDIYELASLIISHGLKDLPWQLSGTTIAQHTPPSCAFRLGDAYCLISNPEAEHVLISSVLLKANSHETAQSSALLRAVFFRFLHKVWHVSAIFPEEMGVIFEQAGMQREEISQWQMTLKF